MSTGISARQVPGLVGTHQDYLRGNDYVIWASSFFRQAYQQAREANPHTEEMTDEQIQEYAAYWCEAERNRLNISTLFHITDSMAQVATFAARKLEPTERLTVDMMPARIGALVFEKPLYLLDAWTRRIGITMVTWYVDDDGDLLFNHYTATDDPGDDYNKVLRARAADDGGSTFDSQGPLSLAYSGGSRGELGGWLTDNNSGLIEQYRRTHTDGAAVDETVFGIERDSDALVGLVPMFANFPHIIFSIFSLMGQTIAELSTETDRRLARRWRGKRRPPTTVTVIALRRKEYHGYHEQGTGTWLTYRSITRGHWRQQPYGPGRSEVRRIWISPYWRGPEDASIYQPPRVNTLAR